MVHGREHFPARTLPPIVRWAWANITPVSKTIGDTATATPQRTARIAFHANRVEHFQQIRPRLLIHAIGHVMVGITARMEHRVRRLERDIIHPLAITPAPRAQTVRQTVRTPVPAVQPIPVHGHVMVGITARMEHRVRRLERDIIHPLAITPAPRAQILNRQTVRIPVLVAQQIHALGRAMVGITARMEHRVPRLVRDIIPRREQTPAPHVQMVRQTVHTLVPAVRPIHVHTPATTVITNNLPRT